MTIYVDRNDPKKPRFGHASTFYCTDYDVTGPVAARMLAAQYIADTLERLLQHLSTTHVDAATAEKLMEETWHEIEATVRPLDGTSLAMKQSAKGTEVPTSALSPETLEPVESRSSTKRKSSQST